MSLDSILATRLRENADDVQCLSFAFFGVTFVFNSANVNMPDASLARCVKIFVSFSDGASKATIASFRAISAACENIDNLVGSLWCRQLKISKS